MFKAIVIVPNDKTTDSGSLLAIARAEACRHGHVKKNLIAIVDVLILLKNRGCRVVYG